MPPKICYNSYREDIYCLYCKERIKIGERYVIVYEIYSGETIEKYYHIDHCPIENEEDQVYISKEE